MKRLVTFRIDSGLLDHARRAAEAENRTLTNFVETVLKQRLIEPDGRAESVARQAGGAVKHNRQ